MSTTNALRSQTDRSLPSLSVTEGRSFTYDLSGNLSSITETGVTTTFTWDAADRLLPIKKGSTESRFSYDGMNRWVKIVELSGTTVTSTKEFIWCGLSLCEERSGTSVKRYFPHGYQEAGGAKYYYTRDHLGSVREVRDSAGTIVSRYRYDPYGTRTLVSGTDKSDFGFTGHYLHKPSGLLLAPFRAYSPGLGRWMSRDPISERGGLNLYRYTDGAPVKKIDPDGRNPILACALNPALCAAGVNATIEAGVLIVGIGVAAGTGWWLGDQLADVTNPNVMANPLRGEPGSTVECPGKSGRKQTRRYGPDGYPETDTDWDHDHGQGRPHVHDWSRPDDGGRPTADNRGPGRPPRPGDPGF